MKVLIIEISRICSTNAAYPQLKVRKSCPPYHCHFKNYLINIGYVLLNMLQFVDIWRVYRNVKI